MKHIVRLIRAMLVVLLYVLSACISAEETTSPLPASPLPASGSPLHEPPSPTDIPAEASWDDSVDIIDLAIADLTRQLGRAPTEVKMMTADEVGMGNQELECGPWTNLDQPAESLETVIVLEVEEDQYTYRTDGKRLIRCADGVDVSAVAHLFELARTDLAAELEIEPTDIELVEVEPVQWRNSSLGCPMPGMMYAQVITPGYRLTVEADGQVYVYHADSGQRIVRCDEK